MLNKKEVYSCLGEVLILTCMNHFPNYSLGKVDPIQVKEIEQKAEEIGIKPAELRNSLGRISEDSINQLVNSSGHMPINATPG